MRTISQLDFPRLGAVLDTAYADLFGRAPHIENEAATRQLLAKRIVTLATTGETDPKALRKYAMAGFCLSIMETKEVMIERPMRFRVQKDRLVINGIRLPKGDYDGRISWNNQSYRGYPNRVPGPSMMTVTCALFDTNGQSEQSDEPRIDLDASAAIERGDVVVL